MYSISKKINKELLDKIQQVRDIRLNVIISINKTILSEARCNILYIHNITIKKSFFNF